MITTLLAYAMLSNLACSTSDDSADTSADTDTDTDADTDADADPTFTVTFGATSLDLAITNGAMGGYDQYGIAETAQSDDPWTGEDCLNGYTLNNGDVLAYCHTASATGESLAYGGSTSDLDVANDTVFSSNFDGRVTYFLNSGDSCWVFGNDVSYYSGLGCTNL